jgi:hypothetical protein
LQKEIEIFKECLDEGKDIWKSKIEEIKVSMTEQELEN